MKTAIVHDWLNGMRGGEKVLDALIEVFPEATIYTLFCERVKIAAPIAERKIVTSWLQGMPGIFRHYRNFLPLFPAAIESFDLRDFDLVISSSHAVAKGVRAPNALHICYCHTPMRYLWDAETGDIPLHQRLALRLTKTALQRWDRSSADRVDHFIANSGFVQGRIRQYYGRNADVIFPPVDTVFFTPSSETAREDFYLAAGAMVSYKRFDLILDAFRQLSRPLLVAGSGPEFHRLQRQASSNVRFLGRVSDSELRDLYRKARAFVFAAREDFGIMPVEARCCGCPVIGLADGGVSESVRDGISGVLFEKQEAKAVAGAIARFERSAWPVEQVRLGVEEFSRERFKQQVRRFVSEKTQGAPKRSKSIAETASIGRRT